MEGPWPGKDLARLSGENKEKNFIPRWGIFPLLTRFDSANHHQDRGQKRSNLVLKTALFLAVSRLSGAFPRLQRTPGPPCKLFPWPSESACIWERPAEPRTPSSARARSAPTPFRSSPRARACGARPKSIPSRPSACASCAPSSTSAAGDPHQLSGQRLQPVRRGAREEHRGLSRRDRAGARVGRRVSRPASRLMEGPHARRGPQAGRRLHRARHRRPALAGNSVSHPHREHRRRGVLARRQLRAGGRAGRRGSSTTRPSPSASTPATPTSPATTWSAPRATKRR